MLCCVGVVVQVNQPADCVFCMRGTAGSGRCGLSAVQLCCGARLLMSVNWTLSHRRVVRMECMSALCQLSHWWPWMKAVTWQRRQAGWGGLLVVGKQLV